MKYFLGRRYQDNEVRGLIQEYGTVLADRDTDGRGMRAIIMIVDLKNGWKRLNLGEREVLLRRGVLSQTVWETAAQMRKSTTWVDKQFNIAVANLTSIMNGDA